jgi:hypothetical protein
MASDRPGIVMRQMLLSLLERHGETEATSDNRVALTPVSPRSDMLQAG